jgi:pyrroloquinoline quinone biosynthesis protein D
VSGDVAVDALALTESSVPHLPRSIRLKFDAARDEWVLLAPERVFKLDAIATEIVKRVDGVRTVALIVDDLAGAFAAPRETIRDDVLAMLSGLRDKGVLLG